MELELMHCNLNIAITTLTTAIDTVSQQEFVHVLQINLKYIVLLTTNMVVFLV
jgi:hypothetical protein